jgi:DNA-binding MurR/RpiR family transcriptional regulator
LSRLRPEVHLLAGRAASWAEDLAMLGPRDALLVTAFRPAQRPLRAILGWARTSRVEVIAITDPTSRERFARLGALPICCHVMGANLGGGLGVSHTTATSMLRLIALAMADRIGAPALRRQELIAAIHDELEDIE